MEVYDLAVIGGGPGGYVAAIRAAQLGLRTCLIERRAVLGGTCLNVGCIPSKALLESSELFAMASDKMVEHGVVVGELKLNLSAMMQRKRRIVGELVDGLNLLMTKNRIAVRHGHAQLRGSGRVGIRRTEDSGASVEEELAAQKILLAAGSEPTQLPFLPFDGQRIISSTEALSFDQVPRHLIVVGGGAIGIELGSVWRRLGAEVSVVELLPRIVPQADHEMSKLLLRSLQRQGLRFELESRVTGADVQVNDVTLHYTDAQGNTHHLGGSHVLVAVGRKAATSTVGLDQLGIEVRDGKVVVNSRYETSVEGIYAIGDMIDGPMLAHKAEEEGVAVAELLAGKPGHVNYDTIPNIVYTWPELAEVGLSQEAAKQRGFAVRVGKYRFAANGRAKTLGEDEGMVKLVAEARSDRLLGAHIVGPRAAEMIAELVLAMEFQACAEDIARTSHAHPTLSEVVKEAALAVDGRVIHG